ncbi:PEP-CTERM sorting domain-containing protein [Verrucomicrobiaceae bacterium N1E253]|uniref:PEP-CTERM sorting domain-containing protein n=1 Tax=Oceaniferula marina TaxID=2748318 RepID=A0A851GCD0_9BACT|nr:PEP-CTERM sorting domain-containing protein [Oceaniferula marina]NWK54592.1 PEP-CTERM sorting domain-containing protein [Oceaniferula marina]
MIFSRTPCCMVMASAFLASIPSHAANLITNGDFSGGTSGTYAPGSATGGANNVPTGWVGYATGNDSLFVNGSQRVNFNGGDKPSGSYIEQSVSTQTNRWYALAWQQQSHSGTDNGGVLMTSTLTSGAASTTSSLRGMLDGASLIHTMSTSTTVRLSDIGASTVSLDTQLDNVVLDLANGQYNVAHLATLSSDSQYGLGTWGNEENAVDGRIGATNSSNTIFHSNNNSGGWYEMDFTLNAMGAYIDRIEIEARPGFNSRMGDSIQIYSTSDALLETIVIDDSSGSFGVDGTWSDVGRIRIANDGDFINLAEVRTFSSFVDGVMVPEPSSLTLLGLGSLALVLRRRK